MANLLVRPDRTDTPNDLSAVGSSRPAQSAALRGVVAAAWTAILGLFVLSAVSVSGWFAAETGTFSDSIRVGALAWLVSNGSGLHLASASITVLPLGATAATGWLLYRSGRWVGGHLEQAAWRDLTVGCGALAATYAGIAVVAAVVTRSSAAAADSGRTLVATLLLAGLFGTAGALRGAGRLGRLYGSLPEDVRAAATGGAAGCLALCTASAVLLAASLCTHFFTAVTLAEQMRSGLVGGAIISLIGLAFLPNAVMCAGAFISGPGFSIGTGTVDPSSGATGQLPGLPLLAAIPRTGMSVQLELGVLLLPVLAGALAGVVAVHRFPVVSLQAAAARGGLAGVTAGGVFGVLALLSAGGVGPGRMENVGPQPGVVLASGLVCMTAGAAAAAVHRVWRVRLREQTLDG